MMTIFIVRNIKTSALIIVVHDPPTFTQDSVGVKGISTQAFTASGLRPGLSGRPEAEPVMRNSALLLGLHFRHPEE